MALTAVTGGHRTTAALNRAAPACRPKGARNFKTDLDNTLKKRVPIREDGKLRYASSLEAIALKMYDTAAQGDTKATSQLMARILIPPFPGSNPGQSLFLRGFMVLTPNAR